MIEELCIDCNIKVGSGLFFEDRRDPPRMDDSWVPVYTNRATRMFLAVTPILSTITTVFRNVSARASIFVGGNSDSWGEIGGGWLSGRAGAKQAKREKKTPYL